VEARVTGLSWKQAVRAATTAAGTLASDFENGDTVDGVTLATGDRILVKDQAALTENGIYTVNASGAPTRATDADDASELVNASCYVSEGTTNADTQWVCTTNAPITLGVTNLAFTQLTSGGGVSDGDKGDVTVSSSGTVWTVDNDAITFAKIQNISTSRILGRKTASSGDVEELTASDVLTLLGSTPSPGSGLPYMYPFGDAIDDPINDNFREGDGAGGMDTSGTRANPSTPTAWTARNISGSETIDVGSGRLWLTSSATTTLQIRGYDQPVPSGNWCIRMSVAIRPGSTSTTQRSVGMYIHDSVGGKYEFWSIGYVSNALQVWAGQMTDFDSHAGNRYIGGNVAGTMFPTFLEIEYDGTNYYFRHGMADGGLHRVNAGLAFAKTNFLANAADSIGVFSQNNQSVATTLITTGFYRVPESSVL